MSRASDTPPPSLHLLSSSLHSISSHPIPFLHIPPLPPLLKIKPYILKPDTVYFARAGFAPSRYSIFLETLLRDLGLSRGNSGGRVGVDKAAPLLAVLCRGRLSAANALLRRADLGTAGGAAVGVRDAAARGELLSLAVSDVFGSRVVGSQGEGGNGDCGASAFGLAI